ncbi:MAG: hypothetical protein N2444_09635 [Methylocystis sp.]|nr:hypothetical protein [Methylocystis sp.]
MKKFAILTAAALVAGLASPAFADCDTRKADEDKQAKAASLCYDDYLSRKMNYGSDKAKLHEEFKACNAKAGCPQNDKLLD